MAGGCGGIHEKPSTIEDKRTCAKAVANADKIAGDVEQKISGEVAVNTFELFMALNEMTGEKGPFAEAINTATVACAAKDMQRDPEVTVPIQKLVAHSKDVVQKILQSLMTPAKPVIE